MCSREAGVGAPFTGNETTSTGGDVDASGIAKAATVNKCGPSDVVVRLAKLGDAANLTKIINTAIGASRVDRVNEFGVDRVTADGKQGKALADLSKFTGGLVRRYRCRLELILTGI